MERVFDMVPQEIMEWYLSLRGSPTYQVGLLGWAWIPIIGGFIESRCVIGKGYLVPQERGPE